MNRIKSWLQSSLLRNFITVFFLAISFLVVPAFAYSQSLQAQAETLIAANSYQVDSATVKRIQEKAEDLGDSPERPIGDTGLKNIRKLGENIPETLELNRRQGFVSGDPDNLNKRDALDEVQDRIGSAVDNTKRAAKDVID